LKTGEEKNLLHEVPDEHEQEAENTTIREIFSQKMRRIKQITKEKLF